MCSVLKYEGIGTKALANLTRMRATCCTSGRNHEQLSNSTETQVKSLYPLFLRFGRVGTGVPSHLFRLVLDIVVPHEVREGQLGMGRSCGTKQQQGSGCSTVCDCKRVQAPCNLKNTHLHSCRTACSGPYLMRYAIMYQQSSSVHRLPF